MPNAEYSICAVRAPAGEVATIVVRCSGATI
jgi:hypothetical protein